MPASIISSRFLTTVAAGHLRLGMESLAFLLAPRFQQRGWQMSTALRDSFDIASPGSLIFVGNLARCKPLIAAGLRSGKRILYTPEIYPAQQFINRDIYDLMILDKQLPSCEVHEALRMVADLAYDLPLVIANEKYLTYICRQLREDSPHSLRASNTDNEQEVLMKRIESVIQGNSRRELGEEDFRFVKDRHQEAVVFEMAEKDLEDRVPGSIARAIQHIVAHSREPLELAKVAHVACMSRFHFCRQFKKWTGMSFKSFLICSRIELAMRMLTLGHHSVTEVCYAVGFADLSNFDRTFHRLVGQSPLQFRKSAMGVLEQKSTSIKQFAQSTAAHAFVD